jgi:hypothetical protein
MKLAHTVRLTIVVRISATARPQAHPALEKTVHSEFRMDTPTPTRSISPDRERYFSLRMTAFGF